MTERFLVGRVKRAHGVRGALLIDPITDTPEAIFASGAVVYVGSADGRHVDDAPWRVTSARAVTGGVLVTLAGLADRDAAAGWKARTIFADADALPAPADDEVYVHDLIGLTVLAHDGAPVGPVVDVYDAPQGLIIEVETAGGRRLVPWRDELIAAADHAARTVTLVNLPGLVD